MSREVIGQDAPGAVRDPDVARADAAREAPDAPVGIPAADAGSRPGRRSQLALAAAAGAVAGALVAGLTTASLMERRQEAAGLESVRLITSLQYLPYEPDPGPSRSVNLSFSVISTATVPVRVVDVDFAENIGSSLTLRQPVWVEPGVTARVPVHAELHCGQLLSSAIAFTVETDGGHRRIVQAAGIVDDAAPQIADLAYLCAS